MAQKKTKGCLKNKKHCEVNTLLTLLLTFNFKYLFSPFGAVFLVFSVVMLKH